MDPTTQTALTTIFAFLPPPYNAIAASAVGIAGIVSMGASVVGASIKPPSTNSAGWKQTLYSVVTWPALNLGWARNAVVPGMPPAVQQAALVSAKLAAAMPSMTVVAVPPAVVQGVIVPAASQ